MGVILIGSKFHDDKKSFNRIRYIDKILPIVEKFDKVTNRTQSMEETLRNKGYTAVRKEVAKIVTKGDGAECTIDRFFNDSGAYQAASTVLTNLLDIIPTISKARLVVDLTSTTGQLASIILNVIASYQQSSRDSGDSLTFYANDIREYRKFAKQVLDRTCADLNNAGKDASVIYSTVDPAAELDVLKQDSLFGKLMGKANIVFWHDIHYFGGRGRLAYNAFHLLAPGGIFVIIDIYPARTIPEPYLNGEDSKMLSSLIAAGALEKTTLEKKVLRRWKIAMTEYGIPEERLPDIPIMLIGNAKLVKDPNYPHEVYCIGFQKPEI